jgi:hypothetical protein
MYKLNVENNFTVVKNSGILNKTNKSNIPAVPAKYEMKNDTVSFSGTETVKSNKIADALKSIKKRLSGDKCYMKYAPPQLEPSDEKKMPNAPVMKYAPPVIDSDEVKSVLPEYNPPKKKISGYGNNI